jgi:hypothetical protein
MLLAKPDPSFDEVGEEWPTDKELTDPAESELGAEEAGRSLFPGALTLEDLLSSLFICVWTSVGAEALISEV